MRNTMNIKLVTLSLALFIGATTTTTLAQTKNYKMPAGISQQDYMPNRIVFKLNEGVGVNNTAIQTALSQVGAVTTFRKFPNAEAPRTTHNALGQKFANLTLIYETEIGGGNLERAINTLLATGLLQYAEPHIIPHTQLTPNDPQVGSQYHINRIKAPQGWDISIGDTNTVVGITDTGNDTNHPDLNPNVKRNINDPINGLDDDNDGYVDNYLGWDVGSNDNDTQAGGFHGVHVAGLAAAATNNNVGVAGVGYRCKFLPIKIADNSGALVGAFEGITYGADHGCKVINCSWGSNFFSSAGQDVIDYATINKDVLVVAAAGNDASDETFYPAGYQYVFNVASTNTIDRKSSFSNYGYTVDVCAPGENVLSTWNIAEGGYTSSSGTSMASPVCAGAAGIVRSQFPNFTALQAAEKLRVTADFIDNTAGNQTWAEQLGSGRINLEKALGPNNIPSVQMTPTLITDGNDNAFVANDTVSITGLFTNYLAPTANLQVVMSATSPFVDLIETTSSLGVINTLASASNTTPFKLVIKPNCPLNEEVELKFTLTDGSYTAKQFITVVANVDYINIAINDVATTITSKGKIGYNNDGQTNGLGFTYLANPTLMYEGGLMIGRSSAVVSDAVRGDGGATADADFMSEQNAQRILPVVWSEFDVRGRFNDNPALTAIGIDVFHRAFAWTTTPDRKYVMVVYDIINTTQTPITDLYTGIFTDWDIMDYNQNRSAYDANTRMGFSFSTEQNGLYAGVKLLSPGTANMYAIDNVQGGNGGINMFDGFDSADKYTALSTAREGAGANGTGNDVIDVVSSGPFIIAPADTQRIAFALIAGVDEDDLKASAAAAQVKYDGLNLNNSSVGINNHSSGIANLYPNPAKGSFMVTTPKAQAQTISLQNLQGQIVKTVVANPNSTVISTTGLAPGMYLVNVSFTNQATYTTKVVVE